MARLRQFSSFEAITWRGKETRMGGGKGTIQPRAWQLYDFTLACALQNFSIHRDLLILVCNRRPSPCFRYWVQAVRPGYILFEVDGCTEARLPAETHMAPLL